MSKLYNSEKFNVELKESISKNFLKTVSAYSNYSDGEIVFGINDDGLVVGIDDSANIRLQIENMINDSIIPQPTYSIVLKQIDNLEIIILNIKKGNRTPYLYKGKAYRRSDTSTVEVDLTEFKRLILEGDNINFEKLKSTTQELTFKFLADEMNNKLGVKEINMDVLKTLGLYDGEGFYNTAAELLADENILQSSGVDIAKFGESINQIEYRETIKNHSILKQYYDTISVFKQYYMYEQIEGFTRRKIDRIPDEAFREALANAIVHRSWDTNSLIKISMFNDRIEIVSPGGLPRGISKEDYLEGNLSLLRNPIIANVFYRLSIIEMFGTGVARIKESYMNELVKPTFTFTENSIKVQLPTLDGNSIELSNDEERIYNIIRKTGIISRTEIDHITGFDKFKTIRLLNSLVSKGIVEKQKAGPNTAYSLAE